MGWAVLSLVVAPIVGFAVVVLVLVAQAMQTSLRAVVLDRRLLSISFGFISGEKAITPISLALPFSLLVNIEVELMSFFPASPAEFPAPSRASQSHILAPPR